MKYKICEYVDGEGTHSWRVMRKSNWIPYWFTYLDPYYNSSVEFKTKQRAIECVENSKVLYLRSQRTKVTCEDMQ
jgi:hypothetical protein